MGEHHLLDTLSLYAKITGTIFWSRLSGSVSEIWRHLEATAMATDKQVDIFKTTSTLSSVQMFVVIALFRNWDKTQYF